jgi:hypothetical protein
MRTVVVGREKEKKEKKEKKRQLVAVQFDHKKCLLAVRTFQAIRALLTARRGFLGVSSV